MVLFVLVLLVCVALRSRRDEDGHKGSRVCGEGCVYLLGALRVRVCVLRAEGFLGHFHLCFGLVRLCSSPLAVQVLAQCSSCLHEAARRRKIKAAHVPCVFGEEGERGHRVY